MEGGQRGISIDNFWSWEARSFALPVDLDNTGQLLSLIFPQLLNRHVPPNEELEALFKLVSWFLVLRKKAMENSTAAYNDSGIP